MCNVSIFRYGLFVPRSVKKTEAVKTTNVFGDADSDNEEVRRKFPSLDILGQIKGHTKSFVCFRLPDPGFQNIKLEYSLKLKIKCNDRLPVDMCPQAANHWALFEFENERKFYNLEALSTLALPC